MKKTISSAILITALGMGAAATYIPTSHQDNIEYTDTNSPKENNVFDDLEGKSLFTGATTNGTEGSILNNDPNLTTGDFIGIHINFNKWSEAGFENTPKSEQISNIHLYYTSEDYDSANPKPLISYDDSLVYQKITLDEKGFNVVFKAKGIKPNVKIPEYSLFNAVNAHNVVVQFDVTNDSGIVETCKGMTTNLITSNNTTTYFYTSTAIPNKMKDASFSGTKDDAEEKLIYKTKINVENGNQPYWYNPKYNEYWDWEDTDDWVSTDSGSALKPQPTPSGSLPLDEEVLNEMITSGKITIKSEERNLASNAQNEMRIDPSQITIDETKVEVGKEATIDISFYLKPYHEYTDFEISSDFGAN